MPEGRHVFLHMTVEENLDMGAYTQPASTIAPNKEKVFELFPRLKERRKQLAKEVSKMGEEQRSPSATSAVTPWIRPRP